MKVLFVSSGNKSNEPGQPGAVVYNQGESLKNLGIKIDYFLIKGKGFWGYLSNLKNLTLQISKNKYDIIHAHYSLSALTATLPLVFNRSIPVIVSLMGSDTQLKGINRFLVKVFSRYFWTTTIVKSESMQENIGIKKSTIIPNGVNINKIKAIEKEIASKQEDSSEKTNSKTILFAADPDRESKNYPLAQKAINLLNNTAKLRVVYNTTHNKILKEILKT